jgi:hypothetical protein
LLKSSCPATPTTSAAEAALSLLLFRLGLKPSPFKTSYRESFSATCEAEAFQNALRSRD